MCQRAQRARAFQVRDGTSLRRARLAPWHRSRRRFVDRRFRNGSGLLRCRLERQRSRRRGRVRERRRQLEPERIRHLFHFREIAEIVQAEAIEELARGRVHERAAHHLLAADGLDQMPLDERRQDAAAAAHAADLGDLRRGDRLLVGDDGERFERLHRQLLRRALVEQLAHPFVELGARHHLVAPRDLDDLQPAGPIVVGAQRGERGLDVLPRLPFEQLEQGLRGQRLGRRKDQGLDDRLQCIRHGSPRRWHAIQR